MKVRFLLLYLCFLVSGISALIYEIVWQRMLTLVFGISTWSIAAVLTAYMAGLALGAWAFGPAADRSKNAARLYGAIELAIAGTGLAVSYAIDPLMGVYVRLAHALEPGFYLSNLIRFGLALAALIVPCMLIGATVPVMARLVSRRLGSVGVGFGRFYAVNTLGAVLGAGVAGFFLIRLVGMSVSVFVAVGGNVLVAILAALVGARPEDGDVPQETFAEPPDLTRRPESASRDRRAALLLAGVTGLTALGYEVAWSRLLAIYTLNSVYVFAMILTVYLGGLSLGSALAARVMQRWAEREHRWTALAIVQLVLAMTCPLVLAFTRIAGEVGYEFQYRSPTHIFVLEYLLVGGVVFVPTVLLGMALPILVALVPGGVGAAGRTVGKIYAANSAGTIIGAAATGIVLIPWLGLRATLMVFAVGNFCVGCYAARIASPRGLSHGLGLVPAASVLLVLLSLLVPFGSQFIRHQGAGDAAVLHYAEGNTAVVHIEQTQTAGRDYRVLYVDSQSVAGTSDQIVTDQKMLAHLPLLLHPNPRRALTVGFGSGGTSYSMLLHGVETHCVEIEKAVPGSARFFTDQNGGVVGLAQGLDPGRRDFRLILDDARSWLHRNTEPYDVIVDDLTSIQYRGCGNLFTVECFELIKRNLAPGGLACAWVPLTGVYREPLRVVVRSFQRVFPHTSIWYMNNLPNDFAILVGTPGRLEIDLADWQRRMSDPDVARDLASVDLGSPYKLACSLLVSEDELDRFTGDGPVHTDDRPILDYLTHAGVYDDTLAENVRALLACRTDGRRFVTSRPIGVPRDRFAAIWDHWYRAIGHTLTGHVFWRQGDLESAGEAYGRAGRLVPDDAGIARLAGLPRPASPDSAPPDD